MLCWVCREQAVCPGVLDLLSHLPPSPSPTQSPSWYLLGTHLSPEEMFSLDAWQCPLHPKARNAKAPPSMRQIGQESVTSYRQGNGGTEKDLRTQA